MASSGMLRRVTLVRTDVSEEFSASVIRAAIGELGTALAVTSNRRTLRRNTKCSVRRVLVMANVVPSSPILVTLRMEAIRSSETSVLTRATRRNIPEDAILSFPVTFPPITYNTHLFSPHSYYIRRLSHPRLSRSNFTSGGAQFTLQQ
jgi:hypothetical protein